MDGQTIFSQKRLFNGLSNFLKEDFSNGAYYLQSIDYRTDAQAWRLLPGSVKESGSVVTDLLKWGEMVPENLTTYTYGDAGNIYSRTSAGVWSKLRTVAGSHGNGMAYFSGDDYLYYTQDAIIGRYGPIASSPQFVDDFLGAQGGIPTNTASLSLVSASSQYATADDSASLSVIGDITLEAAFKATTLPAVGSSMTLVGKWNEAVGRSYIMDLYGISGYFGGAGDGNLTISADTTDAPIDSACTGTVAATSLSATNVNFAVGQVILIHQTKGTGAGNRMRNRIVGYTAGTITLETPLNATYATGAQVLVMKQYGNVTVNAGKTWTAKAWTGTVGGILAFEATGTVTINGTVTATARGFRGGATNITAGYQGESTTGAGSITTNANTTGGGGALGNAANGASGAGGGAYRTAGATGEVAQGITAGVGGSTIGNAQLTTVYFGGGGGGGARGAGVTYTPNVGGNGGGLVYICGVTITVNATTGLISSNGASGGAWVENCAGAGGGAGGAVLLECQTATLGTNRITVAGGAAGIGSGGGIGGNGGGGGVGAIHVSYYTSYTGTTSPTLDYLQDVTLVTTATTQARIGISNDGTANEYLTMNLSALTTGVWNRLSISWVASTSTATFYLNGVSLGTSVGTKTAIHDNASALSVGGNNVSAYQNFYNGLIDDIRIWNKARTAAQIYANLYVQLVGNEVGLAAYYNLNSAYTDSTAGANTLTPSGSPTFSTDVPYSAPTTRLDIDQQYTTNGQTYTLKVAISESSSDMLSFTPDYDPQNSVDFNMGTKGTGNWTVTVHDQQNHTIAAVTVANANLPASGWYEFTFATPWRIVINKTYHIHLTSTVADGTVVTSTTANFSTADFHTYYGFLVNDTFSHPVVPFLNKMIIGNERYLATWDGAFYEPNLIAFPPQTHVRCFGFWRDYLAVGTWREKSDGTGTIYDWPVGRIYFWDGISLTFNFFIDVAEGPVHAMQGIDTDLYFIAGAQPHLMVYQGGYMTSSGASQSAKIKRFPYVERTSYAEVYPQAMGMWRSLLHLGMAANSDSTALPRGVYSWGTINKEYPESLSFDYPISTGNMGSTVSVGMIYPAGQTLLVGWKDGSNYGCDMVNFANAPAAVGKVELTLTDAEAIYHQKSLLKLRIDHQALTGDQTVTAKYKIDREASWDSSNSLTEAIDKLYTTNSPTNGRHRELQLGLEMTPGTSGTSPVIYGLSALIDLLAQEQQL